MIQIDPLKPFSHITSKIKSARNAKAVVRLDSNLRRDFAYISQWTKHSVIFQIAPTGVHAMARFQSSTFASIRLTSADEKDFTTWVTKEKVDARALLDQFLGDGFKLSVSWVTDQNAFCFSVIGTDTTKNHRNLVMTSWADDLDEVIQIAGYKHFVLCNGDTWPTEDTTQRWG